MKIDHIAVSANSEEESDRFFINLLGLKKDKIFTVSEDLMEKFFGIRKQQMVARYSNEDVKLEVFITNNNNILKDKYTHVCFIIKDRDYIMVRAKNLGFEVIKVARKGSDNYYLFIKDSFGNLYEIKSQ
ncbi:MAG: VOC family protein [Promethearchaeota archaeon]